MVESGSSVINRYRDKVIAVKGIEEADRLLREFSDAIPRITDKQFKELGKRMVDAASARTPIRTGRLVSNNRVMAADDKKLIVGNPTPYAGFVENGTSRMVARPFWRPVIDTIGRRFPELVITDTKKFYQELLSKHRPK